MPDLASTTSPFQQLRNAQTIHVTISGPNQFVQRRQLTPNELNQIAIAKEKWSPTKNENYGTPVIEMMSSPQKAGLIGFGFFMAIGALMTGGLTAGLYLMERRLGELMAIPAAIAAVLSIPLSMINGSLISYNRKKENEKLEYMLTRLPEGATKGDLMADPLYRAEQLEKIANNSGMDPLLAGAIGYSMGSSFRGPVLNRR